MNFPELKELPTQEEVDALRAQVEQLNNLIVSMQERACLFLQPDGESETDFVNYIIGKLDGAEQRAAQATPAQCLAEIKAQAFEGYSMILRNEAKLFDIQAECKSKGASWYNWQTYYARNALQYANQVRQQEQK